MKTIWNVLSFLAIVHLLSLTIFGLWLWQSGRLSAERVQTTRRLFAPTIAQAVEAERQAQRDAAARQLEAEEEARRTNPPHSSEVRLQQISRMEDVELRTIRRMEDERSMLFSQLEEERHRLEQREAALERERESWLARVEAAEQRRASEQFAKTVRQYESVQPKQAKNMMLELIDAGGMDQAVEYLNAMNARSASKIMAEFKDPVEIELATELLEQLRTLGADGPQPSGPQEQDHAAGNVADTP